MRQVLNYAMIYGSNLAEILVAKLTCFYNKVLLQKETRLNILMPQEMQLYRADLHKEMFDEIIVSKFDSSDSQFWNFKNVYKFLYFINSSSGIGSSNIFIDHGKVFKEIDVPQEADIVVCQGTAPTSSMRHINNNLATYCDLESLPDEQLVTYDFSLFYLSDEIRPKMHSLMKQVVISYPEYVDAEGAYAVMSCLIAHLRNQDSFNVAVSKSSPIDISNTGMVEDFYTLI